MNKSEWKTIKLGKAATFINGYAFKPSQWSDKGLPIIRIQNLTGSSNEVNYYSGTYDSKYLIDNGDILVSWSASLGVYEWNNNQALLNQHIFKVVFDKIELDKRFFMFLIQIKIEEMLKHIHGATMKHITKKDFDNISILLPSISTQRQIATTLDKASELISLRKKQLEELDKLAESVFFEMFGDPVKNERGWEKKKIEQVGNTITGNTPSREIDRYYNSNYIEWIKTDNIVEGFLYPLFAKEYLSEEGFTKGRFVDSGAILITCIAGSIRSIGTVCLTDRKVAFNQQINAFIPKQNILNSLFTIKLLQHSKHYIQSNATNGMKHIITKSIFNNLIIPIPPLPLQQHFAAIIEKIEQQKAEVRKALKESEDLFQKLMQDLLSPQSEKMEV